MKCEWLELQNFCQHQQRRETFADGLTAVIGRNGSGKSNFLGGVRFGLTGENPNTGAKLDNLAALANPTETSYVSLRFSHAGVSATVRRNLRPAKPTAILEIDGGETIEGDTKVTARIEEILGISTEVINDIVIVAQDEIFGFLVKSPAKRAEQFQRLFRLERISQLYTVISEQMRTVEVPAVAVEVDVLRQRLAEVASQAEAARQQLVHVPPYDTIRLSRESNAEAVRHFDASQQLTRQLRGLTDQVEQLGVLISQEERAEKSAAESLETVKAAAGDGSDVIAARTALANLEQCRRTQAARQEASAKVLVLQQSLQSLAHPVQPTNICLDPEETRTRIETTLAEYNRQKAFVDSFQDGKVDCPTCGTPTTALVGKLDATRATIQPLLDSYQSLRESLAAHNEYTAKRQDYVRQQQSLQEAIQTWQTQFNTLPQSNLPEIDEGSLRDLLVADANRAAELVYLQPVVDGLKMNVARLQASRDTLNGTVAQLIEQIAGYPAYTQAQRDEFSQNVADWDRLADQRRNLETSLAVAEAQQSQLQQSLVDAEAAQLRAGVLRRWLDHAQSMRDVLHKDAAPRFIVQRNLRQLQTQINEFLELFGSDFRVTADEGLSFVARFPNGVQQPAERLSGGQKVVLALTFRLALNLMFAKDVGMLYLDEPTAYLDEEHIRGFEPVLTQLRAFAASRGLQSVMVTHEQALAPLFDKVISL